MSAFSRKTCATLLCGAILAFFSGCSGHSNDAAIEKDIESKLAADPVANQSAVTVSSSNGKVKIKGTVNDTHTQQKVEQIVRQEPGVTGVDNETMVALEPANLPVAAPPPPPEPPKPVVLAAGTALTVTVDQGLSSKTSKGGQKFAASLAQPVSAHGKVVIPKGSHVIGTVVTAKEKGKIKGEGELSLALTSITIHDNNYALQTATLSSTVKGKGKRTAATTGGGAAGGALIGGIAGGGKGAGIGALVGAAGGFVGGALTGNKQIEIPAESVLTFTLSAPLTLPPVE